MRNCIDAFVHHSCITAGMEMMERWYKDKLTHKSLHRLWQVEGETNGL